MISILQTNVTIMVNDINKAITFYKDVLGFTVLKQFGDHYAQISARGIIIGLHPSNKKNNSSENISIGFTVYDFSKAKNSLTEMNVTYEERNERGGNFIHFKAPDGTPLYFINPKK